MSSAGLETTKLSIMQTEYKQQELFNNPETRHELYRVLPAGLSSKKGYIPKENKFHVGNGQDGKHYWLTPPELCSDQTRLRHSASSAGCASM
jgi:hypothetical protein